jgi:hypothetical protein
MARKKGGGGKLNRSEIIQARLDPKTHMAAEIMGRSERRTLSSFIEHTIEQAAKTYQVKRNLFFPWWSEEPMLYCRDEIYSKFDVVTVEKAVQDIGVEHEALRFFKFAMYFPDLLNKHEEEMFSKIIFTKYFWMHYLVPTEDQDGKIIRTEWVQVDAVEGLVLENLYEYWEKIKLDKIEMELLEELPPGKEISSPLKEDIRAIKKYVRTSGSDLPYKIVFSWPQHESVDVSPEESFWKKNAKKLVTQKIEIKKTEDGPQVVTTLVLPSNKEERKAWLEFYEKKMDEMTNGD